METSLGEEVGDVWSHILYRSAEGARGHVFRVVLYREHRGDDVAGLVACCRGYDRRWLQRERVPPFAIGSLFSCGLEQRDIIHKDSAQCNNVGLGLIFVKNGYMEAVLRIFRVF